MKARTRLDEDLEGNPDKEELDRKLDELSGELRLTLPAVTVLLAFLLTVPFQNGWPKVTTTGTAAYIVAFLSAVVAVVLLVGETAYHHVGGRPYDKARLIRVVRRDVRAALALILLALVSITLMIVGVVFGPAAGWGAAVGVALIAVLVWFLLPLWRRHGEAGRPQR